MDIRSAIAEFLLDRKSFGRSPATIRFYRTHLNAMADFLERHGYTEIPIGPRSEARRMIRLFFAELQQRDLSHNTIAAYDRVARAFLGFAKQEGWIPSNEMTSRPRIRQQQKAPDTLDLFEIEALLSTCGDDPFGVRDRAIMLLMLDTGLRAGEVVGLTPEDVIFANSESHVVVRAEVSKSDRDRIVPFWEETERVMQDWLAVRPPGEGPFFVSSDGVNLTVTPLTTSGLNQMMRRRAHEVGIDCDHGRWCHIWRHTFAKRYVMAGGDLESLRRMLGHAQLDTVRIYLSFRTDELMEKHRRLSPVRQLYSGN